VHLQWQAVRETRGVRAGILAGCDRGEDPFEQQRCTDGPNCWLIHGEDTRGSSSYGCAADEDVPRPPKVFVPRINPGIEQASEFASVRVETRDVRTLVEVAANTRIGEVIVPV